MGGNAQGGIILCTLAVYPYSKEVTEFVAAGDIVSVWTLIRGLDVPADIVPVTRAEFEEEKHEIDTLARAAFLRGRRVYERRS